MNIPNKDQDPIGAHLAALMTETDDGTPQDPSEEADTSGDNQDDAEGADTLDASADEQAENEGDAEENKNADQKDAAGKNIGYDAMLKAIEDQYGEDGVRSFKAFQSRTSKAEASAKETRRLHEETQATLSELKEWVKAFQEDAQGNGQEQEGGSEYQQMLAQLPPNQRETWEKLSASWKKEMGLVTRDDQEKERSEKEIARITSEATEKSLKDFGDTFGEIKDGKFIPNPDYVEKARPVLSRLKDQGALTHRDLFILANFDELKAKFIEEGRNAATSERNGQNGKRTEQAKRLNGANKKPSGGSSQAPLYDRKDPKQVGDIMSFIRRAEKELDRIGTRIPT